MKPFAVIDCETTPFKYLRVPVPFVWGYFNGDEYRYFFRTEDLAAFISTRNEIIYAHNGGRFDFHFLIKYLNPFQEIRLIHGRLAQAKLGLATLRDSLLILPVPLSAFKKDDIDYKKFEDGIREKHMPEILKYLESDCRYLYELIYDFREKFGNRLTLAGAALNYWSNNFNAGNKPKTTKGYYNRVAPYYAGGRVQVFKPGIHNAKISSFDINSAYPFVMSTMDHPCGPNIIETKSVKDKALTKSFVTLLGPSLGHFGQVEDGKRIYPADGKDRVFNVTGHELKSALELGFKPKKIIKSLEFTRTMNFKDYVSHFWKIKNEAAKDSSARLLAKLALNSLYGKFAADPSAYRRYALAPSDNWEGYARKHGYSFSDVIGEAVLLESALPESQAVYYDLAVGASITGAVRSILMRPIFKSEIYYCDTDCAHVTGKFSEPVGDGLGKWTSEFDATFAAYAGPKLYALRDAKGKYKTASKGVRMDGPSIVRIAKGETLTHKKDAPTFNFKRGASFTARKVRKTV